MTPTDLKIMRLQAKMILIYCKAFFWTLAGFAMGALTIFLLHRI